MFRTLAVRPEIMRTAAEHMAAVTEQGTVPQRLKELCVVLVSALNDCDY
ncbi:MAG: carboxymuconolactone decarboxylase family protein [Candidatus Eremiobacteraeota bacterium]|nr:carboxymuconolactone decarboxylase family protein [Candidatus Eremiobacteraeota bacterium]